MSHQRLYMACLDLRGRSCLVVGGETVAAEKAAGLLECDARVTVVAPRIEESIRQLPVTLEVRPFEPADVDGQLLVIAATDDRSVNEAVSSAAAARPPRCNVADDPELCSFILPAIVRHDPILVGVSTGGASPALAQRIRSDIAELVGPEHARLARQLAALRPWAKRTLPTYAERRRLPGTRRQGASMSVAIVGAGPGDPGLVTVRGLELIERSEVLVYDRLVSLELVERAVGAALIERDGLTQEEVNDLLVSHGRRGRAVVRLKGGDPSFSGAAARRSRRSSKQAFRTRSSLAPRQRSPPSRRLPASRSRTAPRRRR